MEQKTDSSNTIFQQAVAFVNQTNQHLFLTGKAGTGKTTFVKMWQQYLNNASYKTLYFNAWENDFDSSPLVAIMSELLVEWVN